MNIIDVGCIIRKKRVLLKIDQKALSELSGISVHTLSNIEAGKGNPTVAVLGKVLEVLGLELQIKVKDFNP